MIRNYALTFTAVSLRVFLLSGVLIKQVVPTIPFIVVAEYLIVQRTVAPLLRGGGRRRA
ncbi:hypothetical protein [Mariniluteicoccus flavus]